LDRVRHRPRAFAIVRADPELSPVGAAESAWSSWRAGRKWVAADFAQRRSRLRTTLARRARDVLLAVICRPLAEPVESDTDLLDGAAALLASAR
jgi:hypothetical protein